MSGPGRAPTPSVAYFAKTEWERGTEAGSWVFCESAFPAGITEV